MVETEKEVSADFVDIILADPDLVRLEFEHIIRSGWPSGGAFELPDRTPPGIAQRHSNDQAAWSEQHVPTPVDESERAPPHIQTSSMATPIQSRWGSPSFFGAAADDITIPSGVIPNLVQPQVRSCGVLTQAFGRLGH